MKMVMIQYIKTYLKKKRKKKASAYAIISSVLPWQKSGSLADSEPPLLSKICEMTHKIIQSRFLNMAAITLSNFKWPQFQYFLDDSLHLNTKISSRIYIYD